MPTAEPFTQTAMTPSAAISKAELLCKKCNQVFTVWRNAHDAEVDDSMDCIHASSDTESVPGNAQRGIESDVASDPVPIDWETRLVPRDNYDDDPWSPTTEFHYRRASEIHKIRKAEARTNRRHRKPQAEDRLHVWRPARISQGARRRRRREKEEALVSRAQAESANNFDFEVQIAGAKRSRKSAKWTADRKKAFRARMAEAKANKQATAATKASRGKKNAVQAQKTKTTACRPNANSSEPQDNERMITRSAAQVNTNAEQTKPSREKAFRHGTHMTDTRDEVEHGRKTRSASHAEQVQKHVASDLTIVDELAELTELERKHDICARSMQSLDLFHRERVERIRRFISVVQRDKHLSATWYEDPLSLREEPVAVTVQRDLEEARYDHALGMIKEYAEEVLEDYKSTAWGDTANEHFQELRRTRERLQTLRGRGSE
ncbi:hypothetical protein RB213_011921 [Colletotrichum asianum]